MCYRLASDTQAGMISSLGALLALRGNREFTSPDNKGGTYFRPFTQVGDGDFLFLTGFWSLVRVQGGHNHQLFLRENNTMLGPWAFMGGNTVNGKLLSQNFRITQWQLYTPPRRRITPKMYKLLFCKTLYFRAPKYSR